MPPSRDPYDVLGVEPDADFDELRRAYRSRAQALHPDRHDGAADAQEAMAALNAAWSVVGDPRRRAAFDQGGFGDGLGSRGDENDGTGPLRPGEDDVVGHRFMHHPRVRGLVTTIVLLTLAAIFIASAYAGSVGNR